MSRSQPCLGKPRQVWAVAVFLWLILALPAVHAASGWWRPPVPTLWQWQLSDPDIDAGYVADLYDIDLFDVETAAVDALHVAGRRVICYISVGSWEAWRPDAGDFPSVVLGKGLDGWPGERWLDIRRLDLLGPILGARLDLCKEKGFDGVEADNMDGYQNDTGFPLTAQHQLAYNRWLAAAAHQRGLAIGLKNDAEQVAELVGDFDWVLAEDCFADDWCDLLAPFVAQGKPVLAAEYTDTGATLAGFCPQAAVWGISAILKQRDLDAWRTSCGGADHYAPGDLALDGVDFPFGNNTSYAVTGAITAGNGVRVQAGAMLNLRAPVIRLQAGFAAQQGSWFRARG
jgi:endo-alpha-1,4-polygalactosaminidase (GH114 family)